ncbi:glycosyltransferase family 2 protein [Candidatus Microgenomates bacterium]|nr:glycosyltransferase family 2 protein [Candidatus Microgenomates bacterium]
MISIIFITINEEKMIEDALGSVDWADEIIVVDTGNTDKTNQIAKKYKAKVIKYTGKQSYSSWRNKGLEISTGDWVLYLDADERVTPLLRAEIKQVTQNQDSDIGVYAIPRRNFIFGQEFKHSGQYPDYQKRLFQKRNLKGWKGELHEEPIYEGKLVHIKNPMIHMKNMTLSDMMDKTNWWSNFEAKLMYDAHHPPMNVLRFLSAMAREFWLRMIVQAAFLDGAKGIIYAMYQVYSRFVSYAKLWEMQQK